MEFKRAYQILGVPFSASALSIKRAYRMLANRWHPDHYQNGTADYVDATNMMSLINEAHTTIEHAPLRYRIETYPQVLGRRNPIGYQTAEPYVNQRHHFATDRLEFWVRFICGAVFGAFTSLNLMSLLSQPPSFVYGTAMLVGVATLIISCGIAAARIGDEFWKKVIQYWWLWP
jgi:DnaJ domain